MNLPKTEDNDRIHKLDANTLSILRSGQILHTPAIQATFIWNFEYPVLAQALS